MRVALRVLDAELAEHADPLEAANALCERLGDHLATWVGADGWVALLGRALVDARSAEPGLERVTLDKANRLRWVPKPEPVDALPPEAFAPLLAAVIEILGRIVGSDMAIHLVELGLPEQDDV